MKTNLDIRPAETSDQAQGAELLMLTLREFGDHFFGFGSRQRAVQALESLFVMPRSRFSYQHADLACLDGQVIGLISLFDARTIRRAWWTTAPHLFRVYRVGEIIKFMKLVIGYQKEEKVAEDELYIAHLAVFPQFHRMGYGQSLLDYAAEKASARGLGALSLMTELENQPAINLYRKAGFGVVETIYYPEEMLYLGSKGSLRMRKKILNIYL